MVWFQGAEGKPDSQRTLKRLKMKQSPRTVLIVKLRAGPIVNVKSKLGPEIGFVMVWPTLL